MMRERLKGRPDLYPVWLRKVESPAKRCKERDGMQCVDCGAQDRTLAENAQGEPYMLYLHAAHLHPLDPDPVEPIAGQRLRARCPRHHRCYDLHWQRREAEVEHQRTMHAIARDQFFFTRFNRGDAEL
jgi:hypothetical protein